jgi:hypothetical protein
MTRWSAITRTRGRRSALAYGSPSTTAAEDNLNRLVHHERGRYCRAKHRDQSISCRGRQRSTELQRPSRQDGDAPARRPQRDESLHLQRCAFRPPFLTALGEDLQDAYTNGDVSGWLLYVPLCARFGRLRIRGARSSGWRVDDRMTRPTRAPHPLVAWHACVRGDPDVAVGSASSSNEPSQHLPQDVEGGQPSTPRVPSRGRI